MIGLVRPVLDIIVKRRLHQARARNLARIRESILAMIMMILVASRIMSRYENQFFSLNYAVNTTSVTQNFDSRKSKRNSTPVHSSQQMQIMYKFSEG